MPYDQVLNKFKTGSLVSGSGQKVTNKKQALAIMLSEKKKADAGITEYKPNKPTMKPGSRGPNSSRGGNKPGRSSLL